jgi:acetylornithine deacetylase/succinyl-diaminopimelate desuccinylase-like protein
MTETRAACAILWSLAFGCGAALAARGADAPAAPRSPARYERLAHDILAELVASNTTHEVGSAQAAGALAARFTAAGFAQRDEFVGDPRPGKMNIVVRLHGRGKGEPVPFNAHLDVVEAVRETWSVEPFRLTEQDGYYYGRGTLDIKNEVAVLATNLIRLHAEEYRPDREIILALSTDEEAGGDANGVEWLLGAARARRCGSGH